MTILRVALDGRSILCRLCQRRHACRGRPACAGALRPAQAGGIVLEKKPNRTWTPSASKAVIQVFDGEPCSRLRPLNCSGSAQTTTMRHRQVIMSALPARLRDARLAMPEKRIGYRLTDSGREAGISSLSKGAALQKNVQAMAECGALDETALANLSKGWRNAMRPLLETGTAEIIEMDAPSALPNAQPVAAPQLNETTAGRRAITASLNAFKVSLLYALRQRQDRGLHARARKRLAGRPCASAGAGAGNQPHAAARRPVPQAFSQPVMVALHSQMSDGERLRNWRLAESGQAVSSSVPDYLSLRPSPIAPDRVDEEHDGSYKQQDGMRYSARDVAVVRAKQANVPIVLGSATPAPRNLAQRAGRRYTLLTLKERAVQRGVTRNPHYRCRTPMLRDAHAGLIEALRERLKRGEQSLLFINRRGFAPVLLCSSCAWVAPCKRCTSRLVVHLRQRRLKCHHCGHEERIPAQCPGCGNPDLHPTGQGTQRLENTLAELLPEARILRVDRDSTRNKGSLEKMVAQVHDGKIDILIGTQMLAKGHDFPTSRWLAWSIATAPCSARLRAAERLFAQLMQVAGRAGRADKPGECSSRQCFPDHVLFHALKQHDYAEFAATLLEDRAWPVFRLTAMRR